MLKTYNLVRRRIGDDLGQLAVDYILPKTLIPRDIVRAGCYEMFRMIDEINIPILYRSFISEDRHDLCDTILMFDNGHTLDSEKIKVLTLGGVNSMLYTAVMTVDIKMIKLAINKGAENFYTCSLYCNADRPKGNLVYSFLRWCHTNKNNHAGILRACDQLELALQSVDSPK